MSAWGLAGFGGGELVLRQDGLSPVETDVTLRMGAVGVTGRVLDGEDGLGLSVKSDAMWVAMESDLVEGSEGRLNGTESDVTRLRLLLEGERAFDLGAGATLTPSAEVGLRVDGGDAESGTGVELGAGVNYAAGRLVVEGAVRGLVAHEASGYEEWGVSGAVRLQPGASGRGLSLSLRPTWGGNAASGAEKVWQARDAGELGVARDFEPEARLAAELGYGVALFAGRFTGTPHAGLGLSDTAREVRMGWRLSPARQSAGGFELSLDAARREAANDDGPPEHRIGVGLTARW